ncbi:GNAT family N-acetyltransferase [Paenibacillus glufosinatiresistens]|uniref:GNAT family N-acetyltransferase n=1 Tax=Paenibacillus glufosinatiresistens TaxID=3070657 RepID=UPI00286EAC05|nr:GNAT family N-acetyltransferase [Paenibacillus sp. YX.27]
MMRQRPGLPEPLTAGIRLSEFRDARELIGIDHAVWNDSTAPAPLVWQSPEDFRFHAPPGSQLVAVDRGRICGYLGFGCPSGTASNRHVYEIHIAVHPELRNRGFGTALMDAMKELAAERRIRKLRLRVLSSNEPALRFYAKCGFEEEGRLREEFYLKGRYVDEVFLAYRLESGPNQERKAGQQ